MAKTKQRKPKPFAVKGDAALNPALADQLGALRGGMLAQVPPPPARFTFVPDETRPAITITDTHSKRSATVGLYAAGATIEALAALFPDKPITVCCAVCGSDNVEHAAWISPNTDEIGEEFGSWNAGDNTYCPCCDEHGRDGHPDLVFEGTDPKPFAKARALFEQTKGEKPDAEPDLGWVARPTP